MKSKISGKGVGANQNLLCSAIAMMLTIFVALLLFPISYETDSASATIDSDFYSISVDTNESIDLNITPVMGDTISIAKDTITVSTASPSGYSLFISTNSDSNNLVDKMQSNNSFKASNGTTSTPLVLESETWGFAVAGFDGFDSSYDTTNPSVNSKFAGMPTRNNETLFMSILGRRLRMKLMSILHPRQEREQKPETIQLAYYIQ